jgi:two-component system, chemotaxis family, protein-glutamate methylesterase/glutaminase
VDVSQAIQPRQASSATADAVVMGASAGALAALLQILPALPADCAVPVLVVVHVPSDRPSVLRGLFAESCRVRVCEAEDKQPIEPGCVYFAPPDYHMLVDRGPVLALSVDAPVLFSRPSIDVLFESAATFYGARLTAVVLSGTSADGAQGLAVVHAAQGHAVVQDPETAEHRIMPEAALAACPRAEVLGLDAIRDLVLGLAGSVAARSVR